MSDYKLIENSQVIPRFLEMCPAFRPHWEVHLAYWGNDPRGDFNDIAALAHFVISSYSAGDVAFLPAIFEAAEEFLRTGHPEQKTIVTVGLLEDIQTISTHHTFGPDAFLPYLGPLSRQAWLEIWRSWEDKSSLMDIVRAEGQEEPPT